MEGMTPSPSTNGTMNMDHKNMMRMTLFWGKNTVILFNNWPAGKANMYALALVIVFVISLLIELLSHAGRLIKPGSNRVVVRLVQTLLHLLGVGLSYLVMLALMSYNGGVFLVAVLGHALGFFFCSRVFSKPPHG